MVKGKDGAYYTLTSNDDGYEEAKDELVPGFENGVILKEYTFEAVRHNAKQPVVEFELS